MKMGRDLAPGATLLLYIHAHAWKALICYNLQYEYLHNCCKQQIYNTEFMFHADIANQKQ